MSELTSVLVYACSAVHSALLVGLLKANITGLSLLFAISRKISGLKAPPAAEAPIYTNKRQLLFKLHLATFYTCLLEYLLRGKTSYSVSDVPKVTNLGPLLFVIIILTLPKLVINNSMLMTSKFIE